MKLINNRKTAIIGMLLTGLLWSTGGLLIKMVSGHPLAISSGRSGIAALTMFAYCRFKTVKINRRMLMAVLCYTLTVVGFVTANKLTTAANAILIQYISPIWVAILARMFLKDVLRRSDIVSIIAMLLGLQLFFIEDLSVGMMWGNIIALGTSFSFAGFFIAVKTLNHEETMFSIILGNALTWIIGLPFYSESLLTTSSLTGLVLLGVFQIGLAYILYSKSMVYLKALDAILIPVIEPLLNPVWVFLFIGEAPSVFSILGGIVVIASVVGRSYYQSKRKMPLYQIK